MQSILVHFNYKKTLYRSLEVIENITDLLIVTPSMVLNEKEENVQCLIVDSNVMPENYS